MNQAVFDLASGKKLHRTVEKERFLKIERGQKKIIISKECIVTSKIVLLRERERAYLAGDLTGGDRVIAGWWVKVYIPGRG